MHIAAGSRRMLQSPASFSNLTVHLSSVTKDRKCVLSFSFQLLIRICLAPVQTTLVLELMSRDRDSRVKSHSVSLDSWNFCSLLERLCALEHSRVRSSWSCFSGLAGPKGSQVVLSGLRSSRCSHLDSEAAHGETRAGSSGGQLPSLDSTPHRYSSWSTATLRAGGTPD
ncbi:hypothetical protein FB45DRAFT_899470 [Roridomyces roridus]|uniref:Uncharacterized protein n=1 Tax=Roridomyces roridus TaxID=1738132 RepID=A0AAD7FWB3_9AGAR|nr:hypothetical protein FB45DRAFT_899470 [Roridomyces roridus]